MEKFSLPELLSCLFISDVMGSLYLEVFNNKIPVIITDIKIADTIINEMIIFRVIVLLLRYEDSVDEFIVVVMYVLKFSIMYCT